MIDNEKEIIEDTKDKNCERYLKMTSTTEPSLQQIVL